MKQDFLAALQFLTRIPVKAGFSGAEPPANTALFYPVVGALIGAILALAALISPGAPVSAAIILVLWVLITGALHLDGLADSADAWLGGFGDRERTLTIMKDSAIGVGGLVAVVLVLLLKFSALQNLLAKDTGITAALLISPFLARAVCLGLLLTTPYVREKGLGNGLVDRIDNNAAWGIIIVAPGLYLLAAGFWAGMVVVGGAMLLRRLMMQRIGGATGDTLGATIEIIEAIALTGFA